jgi:hypothetical protein
MQAAEVPNVTSRPGVKFGTFLGQTIGTGLAARVVAPTVVQPGQASPAPARAGA